jgi:hypothetical protein
MHFWAKHARKLVKVYIRQLDWVLGRDKLYICNREFGEQFAGKQAADGVLDCVVNHSSKLFVAHTLDCIPLQNLALGVFRKLVLLLELFYSTACKCLSLRDADLDLQLDKSRAKC